MKLSQIINETDIKKTNITDFDVEISKIADNSNEVGENDLFICMQGSRFNGHLYIEEALLRRAAVIVLDDMSYAGDFPYICVESSRRTFARLWNAYCGFPCNRLHLIAVTGTNGKSSTVEMLCHILNCAGYKTAKIGTLNAELTTPDPDKLYPRLKGLCDLGYRYAVMEASSHALALDKLEPIRFDVGIFTNLTPEHLDFHITMSEYAKAKSKLFSQSELCLGNYDDKYYNEVCGNADRKLCYSSKSDEADFTAHNIKLSIEKTEFDFLSFGELFHIKTKAIGNFTVYNSMAAVSCAYAIGIDREIIKNAMYTYKGVDGRLERVKVSGDYSAFIDYAHTPDALEKVLMSVRECMTGNGRLICIFGCGGDRDKTKRAPMGKIASELADYTIITSDNSRSENKIDIIRDILSGFDGDKPHVVIPERKQAIMYAVHSAKPNDILLFCGKGHEKYEINSYGKFPFDEKKIIQEADRERTKRN